MSSTALLYFDHYVLEELAYPSFPSQNPPASSASQLVEPTGSLTDYTNAINNATLAIMVHQNYDPSGFGISLQSENAQFNSLLADLQAGQPVVLDISGSVGHAVVAFAVGLLSNGEYIIAISDPNLPQSIQFAYYQPATSTFQYDDGYVFDSFSVVTPIPAQELWSYPGGGSGSLLVYLLVWIPDHLEFWLRNWLSTTVPNYSIIVADHNTFIQSGNSIDKFTSVGDSESFVAGIAGTSGVTEGSMEFYAIPVGIPFSVHNLVASSTLLVTRVDNSTGKPVGYGYVINASSPSPQPTSSTTSSSISSSLTSSSMSGSSSSHLTSSSSSSSSIESSSSTSSSSSSSSSSSTTASQSGYTVNFGSNSTAFTVSSSTPLSMNLNLFTANSTQHSLFNATDIQVAPSNPQSNNSSSTFNVNWASLNSTAAAPVVVSSGGQTYPVDNEQSSVASGTSASSLSTTITSSSTTSSSSSSLQSSSVGGLSGNPASSTYVATAGVAAALVASGVIIFSRRRR